MKPFEFDSRNFSRHQPVRVFFHRHQLAGRIFAIVGLVLVIPTHAIAGAVEQIRKSGVDEFGLLIRMAFSRWKDRNPKAPHKHDWRYASLYTKPGFESRARCQICDARKWDPTGSLRSQRAAEGGAA